MQASFTLSDCDIAKMGIIVFFDAIPIPITIANAIVQCELISFVDNQVQKFGYFN